MALLTRRPHRYVPRHSTREPAVQWTEHEIIDLRDDAETSPQDVLASVLVGLDELDRELEDFTPRS